MLKMIATPKVFAKKKFVKQQESMGWAPFYHDLSEIDFIIPTIPEIGCVLGIIEVVPNTVKMGIIVGEHGLVVSKGKLFDTILYVEINDCTVVFPEKKEGARIVAVSMKNGLTKEIDMKTTESTNRHLLIFFSFLSDVVRQYKRFYKNDE